MKKVKTSVWESCYDKQLKGFITPESFSHPAKYSLGLIERIFDYCLERGYLEKGSVVGDCFGGVAIGGLVAAYRGLHWVGVELEPKFVGLCQQNIALHKSKLAALGRPLPTIIQGDSRKFHEHVQAAGIVSSPPFTQGYSGGGGINKNGYTGKHLTGKHRCGNPDEVGKRSYQGQGAERTDGNIETLKEGTVDACISSPPYSDIAAGAGGLNTKPASKPGQQAGRSATAASQDTDQRYGKSAGQISQLKGGSVDACISSPPYSNISPEKSSTGIQIEKQWKTYRSQGGGMSLEAFTAQQARHSEGYGHSDGQISQLKGGSVEAVVSSPPWEDETGGGCPGSRLQRPPSSGKGHHASLGARERQAQRDEERVYGTSEGQIGQTSGETYWQAMAQVYASCFLAIKPGGVIVLVVKDYVKAGKRVPLCDDTARLLEHLGFTVIERIHAMLVKETRETNLDGSETVTTKSRKSFFRRMAEKKGSPRIDFEEVLIARRP